MVEKRRRNFELFVIYCGPLQLIAFDRRIYLCLPEK